MTAPHDNLRGENIEPNEEEIVHRIAVSDWILINILYAKFGLHAH